MMVLRHYICHRGRVSSFAAPISTRLAFSFSRRQRCYSSSSKHLSPASSDTTTSIRLYRILLRQCQALQRLGASPNQPLLFQPPLDPADTGQHRLMFENTRDHDDDAESKTEATQRILQLFKEWKQDDLPEEILQAEWFQTLSSSIDDDDVSYSEYTDDDDDDEHTTLWVTPQQIKDTIQHVYRNAPGDAPAKDLHKLAIESFRVLREQHAMLMRSSISVDPSRGVRVVATSRFIGMATSGPAATGLHHRFAYRIRVENLHNPDDDDITVQLLGRTWHIQEENSAGYPVGEARTVDAPTTGVVGQLPVLRPGMVFEYMSGCELATRTGHMSGCFHMANVPPTTKSRLAGDIIDPSLAKFEMPIHPFPLIADE